MSLPAGTRLGNPKKSEHVMLAHGVQRYRLWLSCGHDGGEAGPGQTIYRRKCRRCGDGYKQVVRVEPSNGR
jgi:hypothetical protein